MAKDDDGEEIDYMIAWLMVLYKGSMSYDRLMSMPIPKLVKLCEYASKIAKEQEKAAK